MLNKETMSAVLVLSVSFVAVYMLTALRWVLPLL